MDPSGPAAADSAGLARRLGTSDAVVVGLSSMLGAGVFVVWAPAARAAGTGLLLGLAVAAVVAFCNATASAQLAAQYPTSGGTYVYARERLSDWAGFLAGWGFVAGKTASCAAMALTFAAYAAPARLERPLAVAAVVALTAVSCRGVTRTARLARVVVGVVLLGLGLLVVASAAGGVARFDRLPGAGGWFGGGAYGILQSAGLLFFAFAGYARIATLAEEVRDPRRTIPRAVLVSLSLTLVLYAVVGVVVLAALGAEGVAATSAPLAAAVDAGSWRWASPAVAVAAACAALGALLALIAGVGRTTLAMARNADLPPALAAVHPVHQVPHRAQIAVGAVVCAVVLVADVREVIGFSSFGVLLYYLTANLAALTQTGADRRYPRALQVAGATGCLVLVVTLPVESVLAGIAVYLVGAGYRIRRLRTRRRR